VTKNQLNKHISVDVVILGFHKSRLSVLLFDRKILHKKGELIVSGYSLPGNHVFEDEDLSLAANRILEYQSGLKNIKLRQFRTFGDPERLKNIDGFNHRVITVAYYALLNPQQIENTPLSEGVDWHDIDSLKSDEIALDHYQILTAARATLRESLYLHPSIVFALLPEKFSIGQLQSVYEIIMGRTFDKRNFRKKISRMKYLIELDEKQSGVNHKPARLFMFSREVYDVTKNELIAFNI
jgi:hypothetical protein